MNDVQSRSGIDRRTVVRAGVATAWTVPLVQAAATAPAFAAVSGPARLSATFATVRNGNTHAVTFTITNSGSEPTTSLNATLGQTRTNVASFTRVSTDWSGTGPYVATNQLAGGDKSTQFVLNVVKTNNSSDATFSITFSPGSGTPVTVPVTIPK